MAASRAQAQEQTDPAEAARFRIGVLRFTPSIALSNVGVDTNVFNDADHARQDATAAVGPAIDLWLKTGPARLGGRASGQYLYFNRYENQRAWNSNLEGKWEWPMGRIAPFVSGLHADNKDRPGYEIDSRVRMQREQVRIGTPLRLTGKTKLVFEAARETTRFDRNDIFLGDQISQGLDRDVTVEDLEWRTSLTPLTVFVVRAEAQQDRFTYGDQRNADSVKVMPGFEFRPEALISGQVFVGVRHFNARRSETPDFTGVVADVNATYTLRATQLQLRASRDLVYSYEPLEPYYAQLDTSLVVTERITSRWDVVGRGGRQTLGFRHVTSQALPSRTDRLWQAGAGLGYRPSPTLRLGLDAVYLQRVAGSTALQNYEGLRVGASFSYGLNR
ncbi:MAG: outer membrane beta-barrel protein [Vicinamibacterales bacterium]